MILYLFNFSQIAGAAQEAANVLPTELSSKFGIDQIDYDSVTSVLEAAGTFIANPTNPRWATDKDDAIIECKEKYNIICILFLNLKNKDGY